MSRTGPIKITVATALQFVQVLLLLLAGTSAGWTAEQEPYGQGLLWKIDDGVAPTSYVFGTMHSTDDRIVTLPEPVQRALARSNTLIVEVVMTQDVAGTMMRAMLLSDGRRLGDIIGPERFARLNAVAQRYGLQISQLQALRPWAIATMISIPPDEARRQASGYPALDQFLQSEALRVGIELRSLETADEQVAIFTELSVVDQIALLDSAINLHSDIDNLVEQLKLAYLAGDLAALHRLTEAQSRHIDPGLYRRLMARTFDRRNKVMAERLIGHLAVGNIFVAVGALHLPGETGVLRLLERRGYRIDRIY